MQNGKTKFTIENATKTRVVLADTKIHILGSYQVGGIQPVLSTTFLGSQLKGRLHCLQIAKFTGWAQFLDARDAAVHAIAALSPPG